MSIRIRDHIDVDTIDFTKMDSFKEYIAYENFRIDVRQLIRDGLPKKNVEKDEVFDKRP